MARKRHMEQLTRATELYRSKFGALVHARTMLQFCSVVERMTSHTFNRDIVRQLQTSRSPEAISIEFTKDASKFTITFYEDIESKNIYEFLSENNAPSSYLNQPTWEADGFRYDFGTFSYYHIRKRFYCSAEATTPPGTSRQRTRLPN